MKLLMLFCILLLLLLLKTVPSKQTMPSIKLAVLNTVTLPVIVRIVYTKLFILPSLALWYGIVGEV